MKTQYSVKDFISDQEIKWCPGCGDYSILKQMQNVLSKLSIEKENIVFVSGIGCSSRFPYYINTFGIHGIHGRAPAIATGIKLANPKLSVWIITGDGDALSIGGNHLIHIFRRNIDINILLFNNEIYGLTKGQFSPTSNLGLITKSSPLGKTDFPFNTISLALGAHATFIGRTIDKYPEHLREMLYRVHNHKGTSFLEIYQNCNIFNDGAFRFFSEKENMYDYAIFIEHNQPMIFGKNRMKGIILDGLTPKIVNLEQEHYSINELWIHDEQDRTKADILSRFFDDFSNSQDKNVFPRPFGIIYKENRTCYYEDNVIVNQNFQNTNSIHELLNDILKN